MVWLSPDACGTSVFGGADRLFRLRTSERSGHMFEYLDMSRLPGNSNDLPGDGEPLAWNRSLTGDFDGVKVILRGLDSEYYARHVISLRDTWGDTVVYDNIESLSRSEAEQCYDISEVHLVARDQAFPRDD
jgi:hypothetical protein